MGAGRIRGNEKCIVEVVVFTPLALWERCRFCDHRGGMVLVSLAFSEQVVVEFRLVGCCFVEGNGVILEVENGFFGC